MSWGYVQYDYPNSILLHKFVIWLDKAANVYFAIKENDSDDWAYYACADTGRELATGKKLTLCGSESEAQSNYWTTASGTNIAILPLNKQTRYAKMFVQEGDSVTVREFHPSAYIVANEIVSGTLDINNLLSDAPLITVTKDDVIRLKIGNYNSTYYGIAGYDSDGNMIFEISDNANAMSGWSFDADKIYVADGIEIDGTNKRIRTTDYTSGVFGKGWNIDTDLAEFQNIIARGVFRTSVFEKNTISAINGVFLVSKSDVLDSDMTALDASTLTIQGNTTFAANEVLRIKDGTDDEWLLVTDAGSAPTYTVTRDLAGSYTSNDNPAWAKGTAVISTGTTNDGFIVLDASSASGNTVWKSIGSPVIQIFRRTSTTYSGYTEIIRLGNLYGYATLDKSFSSNLYGINIGTSSSYLAYDTTSGLRVKGNITITEGSIDWDEITNSGDVMPAHVYCQTTAPSSGMKEGDLWIDTDDGNLLYRYTSSTWTEYQDDDIATKARTYIQAAIPTSENVGDIWIDSDDNNKMYRAEIAGANEIKAGEWVFIYPSMLNTPSTAGLFLSATNMGYWNGSDWRTYIDSAGNFLFGSYSTGGAGITWNQSAGTLYIRGAIILSTGSYIGSTLYTTVESNSAAGVLKAKTFYQTSIPTSLAIGDLWIDSDDDNKLYRAEMVGANEIKAGEWVLVRDTGITTALEDAAQAISDAATAQGTADGKVTTYYQAAIPTSEAAGDLWIDTDDGNKLYRAASAGANEITAGEWVEVQDDAIATAISNAATAQSTADSKIVTFFQDSVPTATDAGDLWVDTNDDNKLYRSTNAGDNEVKAGEWVSARDAGIADALGQLDDIASDAKITPVEKLTAKQLWDAIVTEGYPTTGTIPVQATALGVADTDFDTAYAALNTYLNTTLAVFSDMTATTNITRSAWDAYWESYYNQRTQLLNDLAAKAATLATWGSTTLSGFPEFLTTPAPADVGLYVGASYLGYYNAGTWTSYLDSSGNFYLKGTYGGLWWTASTDVLTLRGAVNGSAFTTSGAVLTASCSAGATSISVSDTTDFSASGGGAYVIDSSSDNDYFTYTGKSTTTGPGNLTGIPISDVGSTYRISAHSVSTGNRPIIVPASTGGMYISDAVNEMRYWGKVTVAGSTYAELATIGASTYGGDTIIGKFGNLGTDKIAIMAMSGTKYAFWAYSVSSYAVFGQSEDSEGVVGSSVDGFGVYGISSNYYGIAASGATKGPLYLVPSVSASAPTVSANTGAFWVTSAGIPYFNFGTTTWRPFSFMHMKVDHYHGDGIDGTSVNIGLSLSTMTYVVLFIKNLTDSSQYMVVRTSYQTGDQTMRTGASGTVVANLIQSFTTTGFTLGNDNAVNKLSSEYVYFVFYEY